MLEILKQKLILNTMKKNHTNVKKVGHTSEFPFDIYWWTLQNPKNLNFEKNEKKKKLLEISSFYTCTKNHNHRRFGYWNMEGERICCHLGPFFALLHHNNPENQNFKKGKKHLEMSSFHACAPKTWSYDVCLLRHGVRQTWLFVIVGHFLLFYPTVEPKN